MQEIIKFVQELVTNPLAIELVGSLILVIASMILEGKYSPIRKLLERFLGVTIKAGRVLKELEDVILALDKAMEDGEITKEEVISTKVQVEELFEAITRLTKRG